MAFDLAAAMRVSGNTPDMYENQRQALEDLQARAQSDPAFRQQMVTDRARNWYRGYMGKPAPKMSLPTNQQNNPIEAIPQQPMFMNMADEGGNQVREILNMLRQTGFFA